jgi:transcription elongation factor
LKYTSKIFLRYVNNMMELKYNHKKLFKYFDTINSTKIYKYLNLYIFHNLYTRIQHRIIKTFMHKIIHK